MQSDNIENIYSYENKVADGDTRAEHTSDGNIDDPRPSLWG